MHFALQGRARLVAGETVLVHGAAGGVGSAACQLSATNGARVLAVVSTPEKGEVARASGAYEVVLVNGFRDEVAPTGGRGVDVVIDPVSGLHSIPPQWVDDQLRGLWLTTFEPQPGLPTPPDT